MYGNYINKVKSCRYSNMIVVLIPITHITMLYSLFSVFLSLLYTTGEMCWEGSYISNSKQKKKGNKKDKSNKASLLKGRYNRNEFQEEEENKQKKDCELLC